QAAGRVAVEAMHGHRRTHEAKLQLVSPRGDAVAAGPRRIHGHAARLVDDDGLAVDEQDSFGKSDLTRFGPGDRSLQNSRALSQLMHCRNESKDSSLLRFINLL